jgi:predicted RND superfamily exporter protein
MLRKLILFQLGHRSAIFFCYLLVSLTTIYSVHLMLAVSPKWQEVADPSNMPRDDKAALHHKQYIDIFENPPSSVAIVVRATGPQGIFAPSTLRKIKAISQEVGHLGYVSEVFSLDEVADLRKLKVDGKTIYSYDPYLQDVPTDKQEMEEMQSRIRKDYLVWKKLVSEADASNGQLGLIVASVDSAADELVITEELERMVDPFQGPEIITVYGDKPFNKALTDALNRTLERLLPICFVGLVLVLWLSIGVSGAVIGLSIVVLSILWTEGAQRFFELPRTMLNDTLIPMMVAVVSSYPIHIVGRYQRQGLASGRDSSLHVKERIAASVSETLKPVSMAVASTMIGFGSLGSFALISLKQFGFLLAMGVFCALVIIILFVPPTLYISWWLTHRVRLFGARREGGLARPFLGIKTFVKKAFDSLIGGVLRGAIAMMPHDRIVRYAAVALLAVFLIGLLELKVGMDQVNLLPKDDPAGQTSRLLRRMMGGDSDIPFIIDAGIPNGVKDYDFLMKVWRLQREIEKLDTVGYTISLVDEMARLCDGLDLVEEGEILPPTSEGVAQVLLFYDTFVGETRTDPKHQSLQVQLWTDTGNTDNIRVVMRKTRELARIHLGESAEVYFAGIIPLWIAQQDYYLSGKALSFSTACLGVFLLSGLVFSWRNFSSGAGSVRKVLSIGGLIILPTVVVTGVMFGFFGFTGIYINIALCTISSVAIGVGADFPIHFITGFNSRLKSGRSLDRSIEETIRNEGELMVKDSFTNLAGFLPLAFSFVGPIRELGLMISIIMLVSPVATLILIPAMRKTWVFGSIMEAVRKERPALFRRALIPESALKETEKERMGS